MRRWECYCTKGGVPETFAEACATAPHKKVPGCRSTADCGCNGEGPGVRLVEAVWKCQKCGIALCSRCASRRALSRVLLKVGLGFCAGLCSRFYYYPKIVFRNTVQKKCPKIVFRNAVSGAKKNVTSQKYPEPGVE